MTVNYICSNINFMIMVEPHTTRVEAITRFIADVLVCSSSQWWANLLLRLQTSTLATVFRHSGCGAYVQGPHEVALGAGVRSSFLYCGKDTLPVGGQHRGARHHKQVACAAVDDRAARQELALVRHLEGGKKSGSVRRRAW